MDASQFQLELAELNGKLKLVTYFGTRKSPHVSVEDWNRVFRVITPIELYERFAKTVGEAPIRVQISFPENVGPTRIKIRHDSRRHSRQDDKTEKEIRFNIYANKPPKLDSIFLKDKDQGKNLAKRYLRTGVDLLRDMGADSMGIEALDIGAYAWAKYGFSPTTPDEWDRLKTQVRKRLDNSCQRVVFDNIPYTLSPEESVINQILNTNFEDLPKVFPQLTELNREIGQYKGHSLTVGKALLIDTHWHGCLPFDEQHISFQRFNNYTDAATKDLQRGRGNDGK